jgi:transposase
MNFATEGSERRILVWLIWLVALVVYRQPVQEVSYQVDQSVPLLGVVSYEQRRDWLFPWQPLVRFKKLALGHYRAWQQRVRQAKRSAQLARLALKGALSLAEVIQWLTVRQVRYQLGALPVLYALLETLQLRQIINRHCRGQAEIDHGTVALVLVLNRLMCPLPLYQVADWLGQTVLGAVLGLPAAKFNDDRLGRTLDALYPHLEVIWLEVVEVAMLKAQIDLSLIFYDLTAFSGHGAYQASELLDFGFAHNTFSHKRKFKLGLNASADGNLPWLYGLWSGRTADQATVEHNLTNLARWLKDHGYPVKETLVVGDRAMLSPEIAWSYDQHDLRYLAGLRCLQKEHKELVSHWPESHFLPFALTEGETPQHWGRGCQVSFSYNGQSFTHKGLVVLAGPIRDQLRQTRKQQLAQLSQQLTELKAHLGQPRLRTLKAVKRRVQTCLKASPVGDLLACTVSVTEAGQVDLSWQLDTYTLWQLEQRDGRYLLVTNDYTLSHQEMFRLYRAKDGLEKRFHVCKADLKVSPVYLHQDQRIASMLLVNMLALLAYSLLERQLKQQGLNLTSRQVIKRLEQLSLIETHYLDGSYTARLVPENPALLELLALVASALAELLPAVALSRQPLLAASSSPTLALAGPRRG